MSKNAQKAKANFEAGFWKENDLKRLVEKGWLTEAEYKEIVGEAE